MISNNTTSNTSTGAILQNLPIATLAACAGVSAMTCVIHFLHLDGSFANVSMLYLLVVTMAALFLGRLPAVIAAVLSFSSFNWFFVEPRYRFTVADSSEWIVLCMFLLTATVTGQLTALLKVRAEEALRRKLEANALADATWSIASELNRDLALSKVLSQLASVARLGSAAIIGIEEGQQPKVIASYSSSTKSAPAMDSSELDRVLDHVRATDWTKGNRHERKLETGPTYLPIKIESKVQAVLYLNPAETGEISADQQRIVDSVVNHAALVLQRDGLMKAEARAQALAEADRLKTALLSMVSHDFRSPLTSIKASVSSLLQDGGPWEPETQRAFLETVDEETDRLNRMVGNILDLSRLEAGAWQPRRTTTTVEEMVGAALDCFGSEDNDRIQVNLDRSLPEIWVDPVQIVQVIRNLLENSLKYSSGIAVELESYASNGSTVIAVKDRGSGLPPGEEEGIFEPFFRAAALKEGSIPGLGLGLALCRGLVEAHGGRLTAQNREGGGAVFQFTLPNATQPSRQGVTT